MKRSSKLFAVLPALVIAVTCTYGQLASGGPVPACSKPPEEHVYSYPVLFDRQILDYADFKMKTAGRLSIVRVIPGTAHTATVPFYIFLKRNGKVVTACGANVLTQPVHSIELSDILSFGRAGDVLVIVPIARPEGKTTIMVSEGC